ncbi:peptide chain release factor 1 [Artomyces pyxidatus]|uniref:Peptide chain release factor 1 n=1 Tax=Artomyces pyxidatus TaxID=48021 RepID=A0ACB8SKF4_9AGAM|nr:peptide chain release factor 1 [Artomyces pyxidatus]
MLSLRQCLRRQCRSHVPTHRRRHAPPTSHRPHSDAAASLEQIERTHSRLLQALERSVRKSDPSQTDIAAAKQLKSAKPVHDAWDRYQRTKNALLETIPLLQDPEMADLAASESADLITDLDHQLTHVFPAILRPPSETAHLSALIELKSGVGGSEASLFLAEMLRMYTRVAHQNAWTPTILASNDSDNGGIKDAILEVKGNGAYDALRWESGVHRVQRVPATEASGRVHTSTVAAVVLPLSDDPPSDGKDDDLFKLDDVRIEVMRARGAGGQHVNKTESAVRLTHMPTGITVSMQDERSQHQNRRRAFQVLRARLMDQKIIREQAERRATRKNLVRTADRSEKIRTYNYPQDRITDHRLGKGNMAWNDIMEGDGLMEFVQSLQDKHNVEVLEDRFADLEC